MNKTQQLLKEREENFDKLFFPVGTDFTSHLLKEYNESVKFFHTTTISLLLTSLKEEIESMKFEEAPPFSANNEIRDKAKLINEYLMPYVKKSLSTLLSEIISNLSSN